MSTLTKVFVLLLSLSSIALSMLVVAAFASQEDWRQSAEEWKDVAFTSQAKERSVTANAQLQHQRDLDQIERQSAAIAQVNADKLTMQNKISELERDRANLSNKLDTEQAQVTSVGNTLSVVNAALNREEELGRKLVQRNSELERRNIDLNDRVQELTANVEMASMQVRALQQQIVAMEEMTTTVASAGLRSARQIPGGAGIVEARMPTVHPTVVSKMASPIRGEIVAVRGTLASISVGSTDGVAEGMTFLIYRQSGGKPTYLGTIRITRVNANESAGTIEQLESEIRPGDRARDEASFAMRR